MPSGDVRSKMTCSSLVTGVATKDASMMLAKAAAHPASSASTGHTLAAIAGVLQAAPQLPICVYDSCSWPSCAWRRVAEESESTDVTLLSALHRPPLRLRKTRTREASDAPSTSGKTDELVYLASHFGASTWFLTWMMSTEYACPNLTGSKRSQPGWLGQPTRPSPAYHSFANSAWLIFEMAVVTRRKRTAEIKPSELTYWSSSACLSVRTSRLRKSNWLTVLRDLAS